MRLSKVFSGTDVDLIKAEIIDESGLVCPTADNHINFTVENAEIIGVGNGNPGSHEKDVADNRKAFNGLAMVIVRKNEGEMSVSAKSEGLKIGKVIL